MKKETLERGATYCVRLTTGQWVKARFESEVIRGGGSWGKRMTHYLFQNLASGRQVEIKSRIRIKECPGLHTPAVPAGFNPAR